TLRVSGIAEEDDGSIRMDVSLHDTGPTLVAAPDELRFAVIRGDSAPGRVVRVRPETGAPATWSARASAGWLELVRSGDDLLIRADPTGLDSGVHTDTVLLVAAPQGPGAIRSSSPVDTTAPAVLQPADASPGDSASHDAGAAPPKQPAPRAAAPDARRLAGTAAAHALPGRAGARVPDAVLGRV